MSLVSIIIINYNGKHLLKDCFSSIQSSETPHEEVILVDNASSDGSLEFIKREFPWVKIIALAKNCGFAEANNIGAEAASGRYLAFLNNDTVVTPHWLNPLIAALASNPAVGAAGSKLLLYKTPERLNSAGANITFNGGGYDRGFGDIDAAPYNVPGSCGAVCAASMLVRREEFLSLGGFDPMYFMYFEDVDLCWRYWLLGKTVQYVPDSVVYHKFGGTSGNDKHNPLRVFYGTRNSFFNVLKNYQVHNMIWPLCFNIAYSIGKSFVFMVSMRLESSYAVWRALGSVVSHVPQILRKRKDNQKRRKIRDSILFKQSLIVPFFTSVREYLRLWKLS